MSDATRYFPAESRMALGEMPYRRSARETLAAIPLVNEMTVKQGLTLVHLSAQRKRFWWDKGYLGGV
jgi:hypothetical protein